MGSLLEVIGNKASLLSDLRHVVDRTIVCEAIILVLRGGIGVAPSTAPSGLVCHMPTGARFVALHLVPRKALMVLRVEVLVGNAMAMLLTIGAHGFPLLGTLSFTGLNLEHNDVDDNDWHTVASAHHVAVDALQLLHFVGVSLFHLRDLVFINCPNAPKSGLDQSLFKSF